MSSPNVLISNVEQENKNMSAIVKFQNWLSDHARALKWRSLLLSMLTSSNLQLQLVPNTRIIKNTS